MATVEDAVDSVQFNDMGLDDRLMKVTIYKYLHIPTGHLPILSGEFHTVLRDRFPNIDIIFTTRGWFVGLC